MIFDGGDDGDDPLPGFDPRAQTQRVFQTQVAICCFTGMAIFLVFCFLRSRLPQIYEIRSFRMKDKLPSMPRSFFGWIKALYNITDVEILENSGLDNFVYLSFFRLCIKSLGAIAVLATLILSPIRYYYTGRYDRDGITWDALMQTYYYVDKDGANIPNTKLQDSNMESYLCVYAIFTYIFTILVIYFTFMETISVIRTRQEYLGSQNSITDRTIKVSHIPKKLLYPQKLKNHIEEISVGKVVSVEIVHDYSSLKNLFEKRRRLLESLELMYSQRYGLSLKVFDKNPSSCLKKIPDNIELDSLPYQLRYAEGSESIDHVTESSRLLPGKKDHDKIYDSIKDLQKLDAEIENLRHEYSKNFKTLSVAFVTMDSVASAQMCAQAIFSSNVMELITVLAPSPVDVNWENFTISMKSKFFKKNLIQLVILIVSALLVFPISYITKLLNVKTIKKLWPEFGDYLIKNKWMSTIITGFLPTYLLTVMNFCLPYLISYLTEFEGIISKGDIELSVIKKNFLYIFFNFFLVFTLFGTLSNYWALLTDTTKIAYLLASSIKNLSLFYVDLILLQGLIMFPFKLIQIDVLSLLVWNFICMRRFQTPRTARELTYKPAIFDLKLILPQHILIFIITLIYSVISTKIVTSGFIYFVLGYFVYKYQLMYSAVHLRHSRGRCWPIVVKRICVGLVFLQLTMLGTLALEQAYFLAASLAPLLAFTLMIMFGFEKRFEPLLKYVALQSIFEGKNRANREQQNPGEEEAIHDVSTAVEDGNGDDGSGSISSEEENDDNSTSEQNNEISFINAFTSSTSPLRLNAGSFSFGSSGGGAGGGHGGMPILRKRLSTIEEEREQLQDYKYALLNDPMDGPWIGFEGDYINMIKYIQDDDIMGRVIRKKNTLTEYD